MMRPAKKWGWFRLHSADWDAQEVATLDLATQGFLLLLVRRMLEQMSPVSLDAIEMMSRQYGLQKRSVARLVNSLERDGVIFETPQGFWCDMADREFSLRDAKAENFSKRNSEISKKRWQKAKEKQSNSIPEKERDIERQAPTGPASSENRLFTIDDLDRLPNNEKIPHDAATAARAEIIDLFLEEVIDDHAKERARKSLGDLLDRGSFTKRRGWDIVRESNARSDEGGFDERSA